MVTVKEAAKNALAFAQELLGENRASSLLLEEIDLSDTQEVWLVTVSVPSPRLAATSMGLLAGAGGTAEPRDYKIISVDAANGSPKSMKIRKL